MSGHLTRPFLLGTTMDEETLQALRALGWKDHLGSDSRGHPYWAFTRGGDYFHVTTHSRGVLRKDPVPYGAEGRAAMTVRNVPR